MPSVEERVAYLEGRVEDHGRGVHGLDEGIGRLAGRMDGVDLKIDRFREELAGRIDVVTERIDGVDAKVDRFREELTGRIDVVTERIDGVDAKVDRFREELSEKLSSQFVWTIGVQVSVLVAVIGALVAG